MGRILSIDVGQKRIGLAVTDPAGIIATPLETLHIKDIWEYLNNYIHENEVRQAVIGFPLQNNGSQSDSMRFIAPFIKRFRTLFPETDLIMYDERFTSVMAKAAIREAGVTKKVRQDKALVDMISATILLQSYMESVNNNISIK